MLRGSRAERRVSQGTMATDWVVMLSTWQQSFTQLEGKRMSSMADVFFKATLVGVGGTIVLDLYALMMSRVLGVPTTNWAMVGEHGRISTICCPKMSCVAA